MKYYSFYFSQSLKNTEAILSLQSLQKQAADQAGHKLEFAGAC